MKLLPLFTSVAALAVCLPALTLQAQNPAASGDPFVKKPADAPASDTPGAASWVQPILILEVYALDQADAHAVLETERGNAAQYLRVLELQKNGKARLETLTAMSAKSGQRAVTESNDEVRYPTEFNPGSGRNVLAAPTAWEMRNTGDTLEVELVVGPEGRGIDINLIPQRTALVEFRDVAGMAGDLGVSQPVFQTQKMTTATTLAANSAQFLGTFSPPAALAPAPAEASRRVWLAFLRVNLTGPTAQQLQPSAKPLDWPAMHFDYVFVSLERTAARGVVTTQPGLDEPWKKVQALLQSDQARLERVLAVTAKSGQRAVAEEIRELRVAAEYQTPGKAGQVESTRRISTTRPLSEQPEKAKPADEAKATRSEETVTITREDVNAATTPGYATVFETHNVGLAVELEPQLGPDGLTIDVNHVLSLTTALGDLQVTGVAARYPAQPLFEARKITTSQTLLAGAHQLVGTFNPPGANGVNGRVDDGRTWLVFVRATSNEP